MSALASSHSLERLSGTSLYEIAVPATVRELSDRCFGGCETLKDVTLGFSSLLEVIGVESFSGTSIREVRIPDNVRRLCERCSVMSVGI